MRRPSARAWAYGALVAVAAAVGVLPAVLADDEVVDRTVLDRRITEASGLAAGARHPGVLYTHNDSDDGPYVYAIGEDGRTRAVLTLRGAEARDWEAIAPGRAGSGELWVGDVGDNLSSWPTVRVYRVKEPARLVDQDVAWTRYDLVFEDGPRDAETVMVHPRTGRLYVVSKRASGGGVYVAPERLSTTRPNELRRVADAPGMVTDGAFSPDGTQYALRGYVAAWRFDARTHERLGSVSLPAQRQGESLAWVGDDLLVGSEGARQPVYRVHVGTGSGGGPAVAAPDDEPAVGTTGGAAGAASPSPSSESSGDLDESGRRGLALMAAGAVALVAVGLGLRWWSRPRRDDGA